MYCHIRLVLFIVPSIIYIYLLIIIINFIFLWTISWLFSSHQLSIIQSPDSQNLNVKLTNKTKYEVYESSDISKETWHINDHLSPLFLALTNYEVLNVGNILQFGAKDRQQATAIFLSSKW